MIVNRTRLRSLTFIILVVCTLYFMIAISLLASAKVHELIAYQLIESKQVVSSSVLPVPFGQAIAKWFLLRKDKDEVSKIFLYDIFLLPKELSLEGDIQGYSVDSNAAEKSFFIASLLLQMGIDINDKNDYGCTSLQLAIQDESIEIVNFLVDHGAGLTDSDDSAQWQFCRLSPIQLADEKGVSLTK